MHNKRQKKSSHILLQVRKTKIIKHERNKEKKLLIYCDHVSKRFKFSEIILNEVVIESKFTNESWTISRISWNVSYFNWRRKNLQKLFDSHTVPF